MINCIIIEDQRPAQKILEKYISDTPEIELLQVFNNAIEASSFLKTNQVDLMFLDIHLPKLSGVDFLKITPNPPKVILTTAFADYAIDGFELNVVDYLLKPFDFSRYYKAINKLLEPQAIGSKEPDQDESVTSDYYFAKLDRELIKISFHDIYFIKASGDFVNIIFKDSKLFLSEGLKFWEELLEDKGFVKVHKSYLVSISKIDKVSGNEVHINRERIPIGRAFRKSFLVQLHNE